VPSSTSVPPPPKSTPARKSKVVGVATSNVIVASNEELLRAKLALSKLVMVVGAPTSALTALS
jgi:hypothetical protein